MPKQIQNKTILDAAAATGVGTAMHTPDFDDLTLQVSAALNSTLTFKVQGSVSTTCPDFSAAQSSTNHWDYVAVYDLNDPSAIITGDTGVSLNNDTAANNCHNYIVNADALRWLNVSVTAWTDGSLSVVAYGQSNS